MITSITEWWKRFEEKHETGSQFIMFFILSNGVTLLQLLLMPILKSFLDNTDLVNQSFQWLSLGTRGDGSTYYLFDYAAGALPAGGGGLSYFLAVQITILIAQVINFFAQRNVTFKSNSSVWWAAFWYLIAYIGITIGAAFLQTLYKDPIYTLLMDTWGWGATGQTVADVTTMIINSALSFWIFFPIFKVIFKQVPEDDDSAAGSTPSEVAE